MSWYYAKSGASVGPIETEELIRLAETGEVEPETLVTPDNGLNWSTFADVAASLGVDPSRFVPAPSGSALGQCSSCHRELPVAGMVRFGESWVCAECKPVYLQRLKEGLGTPNRLVYGGFWIRFAARVVDGLLLFALFMLLYLPAMPFMQGLAAPGEREQMGKFFALTCGLQLLQVSAAALYEIFFVAKKGATPGKMLFRLRVVRSDGSTLTLGRAAGRYFATFLSGLTIFIGYLIAAFDEQKRALHDHVADTRVVRAT
jgi:uncharacterized RDD family membrane protein YckC